MGLLAFLACVAVDRRVDWETPADDALLAAAGDSLLGLSGGATEGRAPVEAVHALGSTLDVVLDARGIGSADGWTIESLDADICQVVQHNEEGSDPSFTLYFRAAGTTDLYVLDTDGMVVDWQGVEVRDPQAILVYAYESLTSGADVPVEAIHVLPGARATYAVGWADGNGEVMAGAGLVTVGALDGDVAVVSNAGLAPQGFDAFDVVVSEDARAGTETLTLSAGTTLTRDLPIVVHATGEVDGVALAVDVDTQVDEETGATRTAGVVRAEARVGEQPLAGVVFRWTDDGVEIGEGTWVEIAGKGPDDLHDITACYGEVCTTERVAGHIVSTWAPESAEDPLACACATGSATDMAGWMAPLLAGLALRRRRFARGRARGVAGTPPRLAPSGAQSGARGEDASAEGGAEPGSASAGLRPRRSPPSGGREGPA